MAITLASTTETQEALNRGVSNQWKTPPPAKPEPPEPKGDSIPLDKLPVKKFIEERDQEERENRERPEWLENENENPAKHRTSRGVQRRFDTLTRRNHEFAARAEAAERRAAELEARINGTASTDTQTVARESQPSSEAQPNAPQDGTAANAKAPDAAASKSEYNRRFIEGSRRIPDFQATLKAADDAGIRISAGLESAIRATPNPADVAHFLAKSPAIIGELEKDPSRIAQISRDLNPAHRQQVETARQQQLFNSHTQRLAAALNADPDARKLITAIPKVPIAPDVLLAICEQNNSEKVLIHLARHPNEVLELSRMPVSAGMAKIGRIAERLESKAAARERPKPPEPISPVGASSSRTGVELGELSPLEYIAVRNRQEYMRKRQGR